MKQSVPDSVYFAMAGQNIEKETKSQGKTACTLLSALVIIAFSMIRALGWQEQTPANDITASPTSS